MLLEILWEWPGLFWDAAGMQAMFNQIQNFNCGDSLAISKQNWANLELDEMLKNSVISGHTPKLQKKRSKAYIFRSQCTDQACRERSASLKWSRFQFATKRWLCNASDYQSILSRRGGCSTLTMLVGVAERNSFGHNPHPVSLGFGRNIVSYNFCWPQ